MNASLESAGCSPALPARKSLVSVELQRPLMAFAPMKGFSSLFFLEILNEYGLPDAFFTEFSRVHATSRPEQSLLQLVEQKAISCPVVVQLMGNDPAALANAVRQWSPYGIAGIDFNVGCPVRRIYKKAVGGGLLKDLAQLGEILATLREAFTGHLSVKLRPGFDDTREFDDLLDVISQNSIDLVSLHARTVKEGYGKNISYDVVKQAVKRLHCPVLANGDITSVTKAQQVIAMTSCAGVMIGRSAIRNPWIFAQLRAIFENKEPYLPTFKDVRGYIHRLHEKMGSAYQDPVRQLNALKSFANFIGQGIDPKGQFLQDMRRTQSLREFSAVCDRFLSNSPATPFPPEPYPNVLALPNKEC